MNLEMHNFTILEVTKEIVMRHEIYYSPQELYESCAWSPP